MERPKLIYLDAPVILKGIKVNHTEDGLKYLIEHYEHLLSMPKRDSVRTRTVCEHMQLVVTNWKQHLELYNQNKINP